MGRKTRVPVLGTAAAIIAAVLTCGAVAPSWANGDPVASSELEAEQSTPTMFRGSKTIPVARAGESFQHQIIYAGKTDAVTAAGLPAGLSMDATGLISGRPTAKAGTYTFTLAAFDRLMLMTKTEIASISVEPGSFPGIEDAPPAIIRYDQPYEFQLTLSGPATTVRVGSGSLPPGVTLTPEGLLSGRLTVAQATTFTFSLIAENNVERSAPYEFSVRVPVVVNFSAEGSSSDEFTYSFTDKQTIAWNTHTCPDQYPYLTNRKFTPVGSIFPSGALLKQPGTDPLMYSATASERDGKQSGVKNLHMYNSTTYRFDATLVLHCTNDRNAAADY